MFEMHRTCERLDILEKTLKTELVKTEDPAINTPAHYKFSKFEVIEVIEDWGLNYHRGNVVKYTARAGRKNPRTEVQDLEKAAWYLQREIERVKAQQPDDWKAKKL